ncbi:hypothetical protein GPEL0_01r1836 [Geoanaerobacter pelophilus]|uniref:Transposase n=1 Tax=Geoanaerobacter pelophilus TaxID=60036 RepID=A0ABQ0MH97_9BACT|nr:hypothetical protein GPEL0_01r1836 [Geoanaerobacter pelophilus]
MLFLLYLVRLNKDPARTARRRAKPVGPLYPLCLAADRGMTGTDAEDLWEDYLAR